MIFGDQSSSGVLAGANGTQAFSNNKLTFSKFAGQIVPEYSL